LAPRRPEPTPTSEGSSVFSSKARKGGGRNLTQPHFSRGRGYKLCSRVVRHLREEQESGSYTKGMDPKNVRGVSMASDRSSASRFQSDAFHVETQGRKRGRNRGTGQGVQARKTQRRGTKWSPALGRRRFGGSSDNKN